MTAVTPQLQHNMTDEHVMNGLCALVTLCGTLDIVAARIDLDTLDMRSVLNCVAAQIGGPGGNYALGLDALMLADGYSDADAHSYYARNDYSVNHGFNLNPTNDADYPERAWNQLAAAWAEMLTDIRRALKL